MSTNQLEGQIERLRLHMYELYYKNPHDPKVVQISQELDELLNQLKQINTQTDQDMNK